MICDSCINVIIRTFQNGGQDPYTVRVCSLDGLTVTYQLRECSREKNLNTYYLEAEKKWKNEMDPILAVTRPEADYVLAEQNAKDAMLPPLQEVAKYKGWPKGKPRGKRGT